MVIMMVGVIFIEPDVNVDNDADADAAAELSNKEFSMDGNKD